MQYKTLLYARIQSSMVNVLTPTFHYRNLLSLVGLSKQPEGPQLELGILSLIVRKASEFNQLRKANVLIRSFLLDCTF